MPTKDGTKWQYINLTKGYICPYQFDSREEALKDFVKYANKFFKVVLCFIIPYIHIIIKNKVYIY